MATPTIVAENTSSVLFISSSLSWNVFLRKKIFAGSVLSRVQSYPSKWTSWTRAVMLWLMTPEEPTEISAEALRLRLLTLATCYCVQTWAVDNNSSNHLQPSTAASPCSSSIIIMVKTYSSVKEAIRAGIIPPPPQEPQEQSVALPEVTQCFKHALISQHFARKHGID